MASTPLKTWREWKSVYYPTTAKQAANKGPLQATLHALTKWRGLAPGILRRHGLVVQHGSLYERGHRLFNVDTDTCALCALYYLKHDRCDGCPLFLVRGGVPCSGERDDEARSPFNAWLAEGTPRPMIKWLERAVDYEIRRSDGGRPVTS